MTWWPFNSKKKIEREEYKKAVKRIKEETKDITNAIYLDIATHKHDK